MSWEDREDIQKIVKCIDKVFTLFDNEGLNTKEGLAVLINSLHDAILMTGDPEKVNENLELSIMALRKVHEINWERVNEQERVREVRDQFGPQDN